MPPQKILDLFCVFLGGRFIQDEMISHFSELEAKCESQQQTIDHVQFENKQLKEQLCKMSEDMASINAKNEKLTKHAKTVESDYERIKEKLKSKNHEMNTDIQETPASKKDVSAVLEWED